MITRTNAALLLLVSTVWSLPASAQGDAYIQSGNASLQKGRTIWLDNCETCHGYGVADAPIPMMPGQWKHRVSKDSEVLYRHAIEGFIGPDYSMMPAKGGNEGLGDDEVRLAVDYMVFLANFYINQENKR